MLIETRVCCALPIVIAPHPVSAIKTIALQAPANLRATS